MLLDSARSHLIQEAKFAVLCCSKLCVIPSGLTKYLQPLDIFVNKSLKITCVVNGKVGWFILHNTHIRMSRASYYDVCTWVIESFNKITQSFITKNFRKSFGDIELNDDLEVDDDSGKIYNNEVLNDHLP